MKTKFEDSSTIERITITIVGFLSLIVMYFICKIIDIGDYLTILMMLVCLIVASYFAGLIILLSLGIIKENT